MTVDEARQMYRSVGNGFEETSSDMGSVTGLPNGTYVARLSANAVYAAGSADLLSLFFSPPPKRAALLPCVAR